MSSYQNHLDTEDAILHDEITDIQFRVFSSSEILGLSVCHVTSPRSFDVLQHPIPGDNIFFRFVNEVEYSASSSQDNVEILLL